MHIYNVHIIMYIYNVQYEIVINHVQDGRKRGLEIFEKMA